jgi:hypothetical protein
MSLPELAHSWHPIGVGGIDCCGVERRGALGFDVQRLAADGWAVFARAMQS